MSGESMKSAAPVGSFPLMELPDELLVMVYKNLDAKSSKNVMETCKRNYQIINSDFPPKIHLNVLRLERNFEDLIVSGRNFANLSVDLNDDFNSMDRNEELLMELCSSLKFLNSAENRESSNFKSINLFSQFFMKHGSAVQNLTMEMSCVNGLKLLNFAPSLQKLSLKYSEQESVSEALKCYDLPNLTELSIEGNPWLYDRKATISLRYLMDLKLTKLVLDSISIEKMDANERFESCKLNLKTLTVTSFLLDGNFESFVKFIKSQTQLETFNFSLCWAVDFSATQNDLCKELVEFLFNLQTLRSLILPFPKNFYAFKTDVSLEELQIKYGITKKFERFAKITKLSLMLTPPFDAHCVLINKLKDLKMLHIKLNWYANTILIKTMNFPNLVNFKFEAINASTTLKSKSLSAFLKNHKSLETLEICNMKITGDSNDLRNLGYELKNLEQLTYNEIVYKGNFYKTIVDILHELENDPKPFFRQDFGFQ